MQEQPAHYLTPKDVMECLKLKKDAVYRAIAAGAIPSTRLGRGKILIPAAALKGIQEKLR